VDTDQGSGVSIDFLPPTRTRLTFSWKSNYTEGYGPGESSVVLNSFGRRQPLFQSPCYSLCLRGSAVSVETRIDCTYLMGYPWQAARIQHINQNQHHSRRPSHDSPLVCFGNLRLLKIYRTTHSHRHDTGTLPLDTGALLLYMYVLSLLKMQGFCLRKGYLHGKWLYLSVIYRKGQQALAYAKCAL
jgi:hypothetical protein